MNVLLLGASGVIGRRVAAELIRQGGLDKLTLAGRHADELEHLAGLLRGSVQVEVDAFDLLVGDPASHFAGHGVVISCAGPGYLLEERSVDAALSAGTDYVSLNDDAQPAAAIRERDHEAKQRGVTIVSGCGLAPGISSLLIAHASEGFDKVQEIEVSVAGSSSDAGGPATDLHFVAMFDQPSANGRMARSAQPVYFPDPVGWVETFTCEHPEDLAVRAAHPSLEAFRFRAGLAEKAVMDSVRAGVAVRLGATEKRRRLWLKGARPLRPLLEIMSPGAAAWTALRIDARGLSEGRTKTTSYAVVDRLVNLASIPLVQAVRSLPSAGKGVVPADQLERPADMLKKIAARGVRFGELEPHTL